MLRPDPMLAWLKRTLVELTTGAALGFAVWCLLGRQLIAKLYGSLGGSFSCSDDVNTALDRFVSMQLYSAISGALVAFAGMLLLRRRWSKSRKPAPQPSAAAPPAAPVP